MIIIMIIIILIIIIIIIIIFLNNNFIYKPHYNFVNMNKLHKSNQY